METMIDVSLTLKVNHLPTHAEFGTSSLAGGSFSFAGIGLLPSSTHETPTLFCEAKWQNDGDVGSVEELDGVRALAHGAKAMRYKTRIPLERNPNGPANEVGAPNLSGPLWRSVTWNCRKHHINLLQNPHNMCFVTWENLDVYSGGTNS